jgi:hypothetical protein
MSLPDDPEQLERYVTGLLREQPLRRAPSNLASGVLAQLATGPWWQRSYRYWPRAVQAAFLALCGGFAWLTLSAAGSMSGHSGELVRAVSPIATWVHACAQLLAVTQSAGSSVLHVVPSLWLYAALAAGIGLYLVLFGLGTVAYRTLYRER